MMEGSLVRKLPRISKFQRREPWGYLFHDQMQKKLILRTSSLHESNVAMVNPPFLADLPSYKFPFLVDF